MKLKELIGRLSKSSLEGVPSPENLESYLADFIPQVLLKSETLQTAFGITAYEMEEVYAEAYTFYEADNFLESATAFRWLVLLNPYQVKYWNGLSASLQLLEKYEKALHAYAVSALLDSHNPYPHFHAYECYLALDNVEDSKKALALAYKRAAANSEYQCLKQEIEMILMEGDRHVFRGTESNHNEFK